MMDNKQVYMYSPDMARQNGELDQYREGRRLNAACAKAIDKAISDSNYKLNHYDLGSAVEKTVSEYGWERVNMVLANTVQYKDYDGRFSHDNREWAKRIPLPDAARDSRAGFVTDAHPYLLDGFIDRARTYQCSIAVTDHIVQQGVSNTTQGNWIIDFEEIPAELMTPWQLKHNQEQIADLLSQREEVADVVINDGCFDVCYYLSYCPNYEPSQDELDNWTDGGETPAYEEKPSVLARLQEGKKAAAQEAKPPKPAPKHDNNREV